MEHFFPRIQVDTCVQMFTRVKLLRGDADVDHTQTIGGIQSNYWGGYIPPSPLGFGTPAYSKLKTSIVNFVWPESHDQVFCLIFLHQFFLSYHTWTQFSCSDSCQTNESGFFSNQIAEAITHIFFAVKAFTQALRNFFEICRGNSNVMQFADSLLSLVCQNDTSTFTKTKSCSYCNK